MRNELPSININEFTWTIKNEFASAMKNTFNSVLTCTFTWKQELKMNLLIKKRKKEN